MNNLTTFNFQQQDIRIVTIEGEPWFVGADVCAILEHTNPTVAMSRLKSYEKQQLDPKQYLGSVSNQDVTVISESGLYRLVLTSRKPQAEPFQDWVVQEVLPSIRKTGGYQTQPMSAADMFMQSAQIMVDHEKRLQEQALRLTEQGTRLALIEQRFERVDEELKQLPPATEEVPDKSIRSCLNEVIRSYAYQTGEEYRRLWTNLYKEYRYRHHVDLAVRAKNQKKTVCDYAEEVGVIDKLYAIALTMYGQLTSIPNPRTEDTGYIGSDS